MSDDVPSKTAEFNEMKKKIWRQRAEKRRMYEKMMKTAATEAVTTFESAYATETTYNTLRILEMVKARAINYRYGRLYNI